MTNEAYYAFRHLKERFMTTPILIAFNLEREITVKTNILDYTLGGVISQKRTNRKLYLVAFYSRKLTLVELNYEIYDKELLAIVEYLRE